MGEFETLGDSGSLGLETIEARIVDTANDTLDALLMESDENELRKPFTPSEAIAMKKMIEGKFKAESEANRLANLKHGDNPQPRSAQLSGSGRWRRVAKKKRL
ncbi:hypothetical protein [Thiocapsa sp.]|uniref:hypothetical protein n=1 Tax=Thiocapsa sp. TaxID=2024551 RepID=UPI0035941F0B